MLSITVLLTLLATLCVATPVTSPLKELKLRSADGSVRDLLARDDPIGSVIQPSNNTAYTNFNYNGDATEWIYVEYTTVMESQTTGTSTIGIDLYLESLDGSTLSFDGTITNGFMAPTPVTDTIVGWFLFPHNACGTFRLVFVEHQIFESTSVIIFETAQPTITITCQPFTG